MSGIVQAVFTDHELEWLVAWGEIAAEAADYVVTDEERHLLGKLRGMAQSVSCKPCREGGSCRVGSVTPADVL